MINQPERFERLVRDFAESEPAPDALSAYVCADAYQVTMLAIVGARDKARVCLERIRRFGASILKEDVLARGSFNCHFGWFVHTLEPEPYLALTLAEDSVRDSMQTQIARNVWLPSCLLGVTQAALGDFAGGERSLRSAWASAEEARDSFSISCAHTYLVIALLESADPGRAGEIEKLAHLICEAHVHLGLVAIAHTALARVYLVRGQAVQAEAEARKSSGLFPGTLPPYSFLGTSALMKALQCQGRLEEAVTVAKEGLALLAEQGGTGWSEVPFRVAVVETLHAAGELDEARSALRDALRQIEIRAEKIPDPVWKERYLTERPDNVRAFELAREWSMR
jgi:hypothetical protein